MNQPRMMTTRAAARRLGVPARTLRLWAESGVGPMPIRRGRYRPADVEAWAAEAQSALR